MDGKHARQLRRGHYAGWLLFAAMFLPVTLEDPSAVPALVFWFVPLTLPFWFGPLAARALSRIRRSGGAGGWASGHTSVAILGILLLPLWLLVSIDTDRSVGRGVAILYLALIPAALKLFTGRTREWRLGRALWLNAVGCLLFAVDFTAALLLGDVTPGPALWLGIPALITVALAGRSLELASAERAYVESQPLPKARVEPGK